MVELNCLGDICPLPMLKLRRCKALEQGEQIMLITDHSCACENVIEYCARKKLLLRKEEPVNGVWELYISNPD